MENQKPKSHVKMLLGILGVVVIFGAVVMYSTGTSFQGAFKPLKPGGKFKPSLPTSPITSPVAITDETTATPSLGDIFVDYSDDEVSDDISIAGDDSPSDPLLVARYKINGTEEDYSIDDLTFTHIHINGTNDSAIDEVALYYPTSLDDPDTLDGASSVSLVGGKASFTGLDLMVPESVTDENAVEVELYVVTNSIGGGTNSGDVIRMDFLIEDDFRAIGQTSAEAFDASAGDDVESNEIALYKSLPTFAQHDSGSDPCPSSLVAGSESEVFCFSVSADSAGSIGLHQLTFDATPHNLDTSDLGATDGFVLYEYDSSGTIDPSVLAEGTWSSNEVTITFSSEEVVSAGTTNYYVLAAPVTLSASDSTSSLSVRLADEDVSYHSASTSASSVSGNNVWSDRSASSHSMSTSDWTNSYKVDGLPTGYLSLSE